MTSSSNVFENMGTLWEYPFAIVGIIPLDTLNSKSIFALNRWNEDIAYIVDRDNSINFHVQSLYELCYLHSYKKDFKNL